MTASSSNPSGGSANPFADDTFVSLGEQLRTAPIVVGVSGEPEGSGPVRIAAALSARYGSSVSAVQVLDTSGMPTPLPYAFGLARELIGDTPYEADVLARRQQFSQWLGTEVDWRVHIEIGTPASGILKYADRQQAALIVLGLRQHGIIDRVLRDETTLNVAQRARGAVLAVVPKLEGLPRQAVVGIDFGPASVRAAKAALDVLAAGVSAEEPAVLRLVYVDRNDDTRESATGEGIITRLGVGAAFQELIRELHPTADVRIESAIRSGAPAQELLTYAEETNADLIAVGSVRLERLDRWLLGSVTTAVVRDGRRSVLVIPPTPVNK